MNDSDRTAETPEWMGFDSETVWLESLNGGAPTTDWTETTEWAEQICRPKGDALPKTKGSER